MARNRRRKGEEGSSGSRGSENPKGEKPTGKGERKEENAVLEWMKSLVVALVLFLFLRTFIVHTFVIISGSMEETLLVGDLLLVNRVAVGSPVPWTPWRVPGYADPERGDIMVFDPPHEPDLKLVKRLIGLPGDTLEMKDKVLFINGERQEEPYVRHLDIPDDTHPWMSWQEEYLLPGAGDGGYRPTRDDWGPLVIPEGHYFMLGDNRETSLDSRYWGLLERWRLEGEAVLIYFSYNKDSTRPFPWLREVRWGRIGDLVR